MPVIDRETQQRIKDAANIVEVAGDYVKLTRRGANYMGLCPFHNERTPSFSVSPRRNFCHCFSCKKGGSPVNFLMEKEGVSYTEALLILAKKYGIHVEQRELSDEERRRMSEREAMLVANEWAMNYFHDNLYNTEEGRDIGLAYLYGRGITDEAIRQFRLGYAIDRGDALLSRARSEGHDIEVFKKIGLVGTSQQGRDYDRFRGRVIFPVRNASGKPVAFGGRALKGEAAKYINSPESTLYVKSNELYGIFEAKADAIKFDRIYLMEGYLDVISSWQAGLHNSVASSGTALTESQINLIHRFTDNVTLIYDGDSAGIKASLRGIDMLLSQKLHVKVLLLPEGEDPDSFAKKHTPEEFINYINSHQTDFIHYKLSVLLKDAAGNPQQISEAVRSVVTSIASIPDEIERISYIKECARMVDIDEKVIARQVAQTMLTLSQMTRPTYRQDFNSSVTIPKDGRQEPPSGTQTGGPETNTAPQSPQTGQEAPAGQAGQAESPQLSRYMRQEEQILKYCVRYGFLPVPFYEDEDPLSVLDFVDAEMQADNILFSHAPFLKIFEYLKDKAPEFAEAAERNAAEVERRLLEEREQFREGLRNRGGSLAKIRNEEEKFLATETLRRQDLLNQFAISFSIDLLINHEDREMREIANSLVAERHTLSAIYSNAGGETLAEEDKLAELVPRALSELRAEILNRKVQELQAQVVKAIENDDRELQQQLMARLAKTLSMRSEIAENLGERIISPR
ncbi:MAG: DNA primase [Muribaculaceae bacterium]|nr:DNA primase [Muribaculaceae bacterium]